MRLKKPSTAYSQLHVASALNTKMRCTNISLSLALSLSSACAASTCESGFHIIVARAALELPGEGSTGAVADAIAAKVPKSDSTGLNYPGLPAPLYAFSVSQGVTNLHSDIASYVKSCPDAKIVLLGYDQGALVVGDVLGGVDVNATDPISRASADAGSSWHANKYRSAIY